MRPHRLLALASLLLSFAAVRGEEAVPVTAPPPPSTALLDAVTRAPTLQAARARAQAAEARTGAAGRFPDPTLEGMYSQVRQPMGGEKFPMWALTFSQPLPKAGERSADRDRASAVLSMAEADYAVMAGEMAADTAMAIADADAARARSDLLERQIARTEKILSALDARLASGSGRVADRLALQTRIASMRLMIAKENRMADDALSDARGRLGLPPDAPLPAFSAPASAEIDPESVPALRLASAKTDEARAMVRMARASARPMTSVGLRFEREQESLGNTDTIGVIFMTELPFRSRAYAHAEQRAARAEETAARADSDSARHRARSALSRSERAERLAATSRKLAAETSSRLDAEYDSLIRSAGTPAMAGGETSVLMVLEILERQTDADLQVVEADYAARSARAELWRYAPASLF
ncbi:MAG: TolC family protein [Opitutus sp.]|nr:TolC family protein [Opitutus sp.]MCS6247447.1 TolC family protein [Opitutus sp.]MCS6279113.1 TolC family protein [Opitutus sp.]MCS6298552.1 TolC family protein [Opitutus sp.]